MDLLIDFAFWTSSKLGINVALIVVGLLISYISWITKREQEYIDKKRLENNGESYDEKIKSILLKQENNEELTKEDHYYLRNTATFKFLQFGIYLGYSISVIGVIVFLINK